MKFDPLQEEYNFVQIDFAQKIKQGYSVCGDHIAQYRSPEETVVMVIDGIGSGIRANIAAHLYSSRLFELLKRGFSLREGVSSLVKTIHKARTSDVLFAAFSVARILNDGSVTILSYEIAPPVYLEGKHAFIPSQRHFTVNNEVVSETHSVLEPGKRILLVTDGISQAGMGNGLALGWQVEGMVSYINRKLKQGLDFYQIPERIVEKSWRLSGNCYKDDTTALILSCRKSHTLHLLTGPPEDRSHDRAIINKFKEAAGLKVICGSTTAEIYSRESRTSVRLKESLSGSFCSPPEYEIKDVDLVTEGAIVLNQLYNILEEEIDTYDPDSCVSELGILLNAVDIIHIWYGKAENPGYNNSIAFTQMGILQRQQIIPMIEEKLRNMGKLVVVNAF